MNKLKLLIILILILSLNPVNVFSNENVYTDNVIIVLDASGSMMNNMSTSKLTRMKAAKSALKEVLSNISPTTNIGLLVFSAKNITNEWIFPLGPRDDEKLIAAINRPYPGGGTPLGHYIKMAADRLLEERKKQLGYGTYRMIIVTDGEASDTEKVNSFTPEIISRGIKMDVIGVDMKNNHTLATMVHSYRKADDEESLKQAISEIFAEISIEKNTEDVLKDFELLEGFPVEIATAVIGALSESGNHPIGSKIENKESSSPTPVSNSSTKKNNNQKKKKKKDPISGWIIFSVIVLYFIFSGKKKGKK